MVHILLYKKIAYLRFMRPDTARPNKRLDICLSLKYLLYVHQANEPLSFLQQALFKKAESNYSNV